MTHTPAQHLPVAGACIAAIFTNNHGDIKCKIRGIEVWISDKTLAESLGADDCQNVIVPGRMIYEYDEEYEKFYAVCPLCDLNFIAPRLWHRCDEDVQLVARAEKLLFAAIAKGDAPVPTKSISFEEAKAIVAKAGGTHEHT